MFQLSNASEAIQTFFQRTADRLARVTGFVKHESKVTGAQWVQTLTFGFMEMPEATLNQLAQVSTDLGVPVTPQGLEERMTGAAVRFLRSMLGESLKLFRQEQSLPVELLDRFSAVHLLDSSSVALPAVMADEFPGCGGDGPEASAKVQLMVELRQGSLTITLETGRSPDQTYVPTMHCLPKSLRISDLGYFKVEVFAHIDQDKAFFLSRLNTQTSLFDPDSRESIDLLVWLQNATANRFERQVLLGAKTQLPVRLLVMCLPQEVADERRRKAQEAARRKGRTLSPRHLALLSWSLYITNAPPELLSLEEAVRLYRVRWQIELIFKVWKSEAQLDRVAAKHRPRVLCELYAKLIGVVITHVLSAPCRWLKRELSLTKAYQCLQRLALRLAHSLKNGSALMDMLTLLQARWSKFALKDKRKTRVSSLEELRRMTSPANIT
jgi:Transposase DDE domain